MATMVDASGESLESGSIGARVRGAGSQRGVSRPHTEMRLVVISNLDA